MPRTRPSCAKGWVKMTWNTKGTAGKSGTNGTAGPAGATGAAGGSGTNGANGTNGTNAPPLSLRGADGSSLGALAGAVWFSGSLPIYLVHWQGGLYSYLMTGEVFAPPGGGPVFLDNTCSGTAYTTVPTADYATTIAPLIGGTMRFVFRTRTGAGSTLAHGPTKAWALTATHSAVTSPVAYEPDPDGSCDLTSLAFGDELVTLASVPAPRDGIGPLTIS